MPTDRRQFLKAAASTAAMSALYVRAAELARPIQRSSAGAPAGLPLEQHLFTHLAVVTDGGVAVQVPPLHHMVVTARLRTSFTTSALARARTVLEGTLATMERQRRLTFTPAGLGVAVAWGLPYFRRLPAALTARYLPVDVATTTATGVTTRAVVDAVRFPSDQPGTRLEENDVAVVLASDDRSHVTAAFDAIFHGAPKRLFEVTSIRQGFVDGRKVGTNQRSLTKQMAEEAKIPGAGSIPNAAQLFLGFTSTQVDALGPGEIANFETLPGVTDQWPAGYFVGGTAMHLSHIYEDLESWYQSSSYVERAGAAYSPRAATTVPEGALTIPAGPSTVEDYADLQADFTSAGFIGHSTSMQPASRLLTAVTDNRGVAHPVGTSVPQRADFNTLDHPFSYSSQPTVDHQRSTPAAGVHFIAFTPTSSVFHAVRLAMDGNYQPEMGTPGDLGNAAVAGPFNSILTTTHRQNFLVPPRHHRSFPLAELL